MDYAELCDYLLYIGETRLQERDDAIVRLKGVRPSPQTTKRSCDVLKALTAQDIERQQSHTPFLYHYLPDSVTSFILSTPIETKGEQYCSDLAVVAYRNYELSKIESVLKELLSTKVLDDDLGNCKQRITKFLKCL